MTNPDTATPVHPHPALPKLVTSRGLAPGRALVLGAGEADALWLAVHGWTVTVVDTSSASGHLLDAASARGCRSRVRVLPRDPGAGLPAESFELVYARQFRTDREQDRSAVLRRACTLMGTGGHLVVIDEQTTRTPQPVYDTIGLDDDWEPLPLAASSSARAGASDEAVTIARRVREPAFSARAEADNHRRQHPERFLWTD